MDAKVVPVILAGGEGTRLWPLSRKAYPKQFLQLIGRRSLFQETLLRMKRISDIKEMIIVTNESYYFICQDQMREIEIDHARLILEPCSRNTAPAIALAAEEIIRSIDPHALMLVLPADHLIGNPEIFAKTMESARKTAAEEYLVSFGIVPTSPKTGYGYIKSGKALPSLGFVVEEFVEKPDETKAKEFLAQKNYFWNSGIFLFKSQLYLDELEKLAPAIYEGSQKAYISSHRSSDYFRLEEEIFSKCPSDSIDYAIMEKTTHAALIPLELPWSDLGCWASVADAGETDEKNNVIRGNVIMKDCERCLLSSESEPLVATIGIKDQIVVSTADAVLVADKRYAQEVKELVKGLKSTNRVLTMHHKQVHCPWGYYENLSEEDDFGVKLLVVHPGKTFWSTHTTFVTLIKGHVEKRSATGEGIELKTQMCYSIEEETQLINLGQDSVYLLEICMSDQEASNWEKRDFWKAEKAIP
jgi:mannose-1-phosphate guanylyltransferase/mannose-6-phosphate isomerase